jgi:ATP-dependent protease ClpP protease subunit
MIVRAEELSRTRRLLEGLVAEYTGRKLSEISEAMAHNTYMTAHEAVEFGIADTVCMPRSKKANL